VTTGRPGRLGWGEVRSEGPHFFGDLLLFEQQLELSRDARHCTRCAPKREPSSTFQEVFGKPESIPTETEPKACRENGDHEAETRTRIPVQEGNPPSGPRDND
jgi:hypothetical protein